MNMLKRESVHGVLKLIERMYNGIFSVASLLKGLHKVFLRVFLFF